MFFKIKFIGISFLFFVAISCKKIIDIPPPHNEMLTSTVFSDEASALSAISGLYSQIMTLNSSFLNGATTIYPALSADELINTNSSPDFDQLQQNELLPSNSLIGNQLWSRAYRLIYHTNAIIEQLPQSTSLSVQTTTRLLGEAKFMRALLYHYLSSFYGGVPLVLTTDFNVNAVLPRASLQQVQSQIIKDLVEAVDLLPVTYISSNRTRPNKYVAVTLLSRLYLYTRQWQQAEDLATSVINSGLYTLTANLNNVFLATSNETIWQMMPVQPNTNTAEGVTFIPSSATVRPAYVLTPGLLEAFDTSDARKTAWLKTNTISGTSFTYPFKYKIWTAVAKTEYNIVFRLAELYLIRAEARAEQEKLSGAADDLNKIRNRASLPNITASTKDSLLTAIENERRVELFAEWGHRWFDLKRWEKATNVLAPIKPGWNEEDKLYPLPTSELLRNSFLTQNPGY